MRRMRFRRFRPRRVVRPRRVIRRRRFARRRRGNRRYDVHTFRMKPGTYVATINPGTNGGYSVSGEAVVLNQLPVTFTGLTLLYTHIRILKAVFKFIPMYTQRNWPGDNDAQELPEILSCQWYGPALDVDTNPATSYNAMRADPLSRSHAWNRSFTRVLYPKVNYFVGSTIFADNTAPDVDTGVAMKKMPWVRTSGANAYNNMALGGMYSGGVGSPNSHPIKYRVERTYYVQARKI
ncbi:capsid protein [Pacific flying fox associated cyclovirus-2]|uniref:Capsid protein n=1 Tax=Pacific flying fox associated cyclovirus-2 TaxID=1795984 RepID=A0A140CTJ4_9CIRC|nr:capsid protein [Pacific flying fox associated cyclovirus-2]AMH87651.1 capsid protein [Pacific flying fox associated cyclovirus-2]